MSERDIVIVRVGDHRLGLDSAVVQDVFHPRSITPVPLARKEILGLLNLRGRIVTAVCARRRLGLPDRPPGAPEPKAVGAEVKGDSYGLVVDEVEGVIRLDADALTGAPDNLPPRWSEITLGVHREPDRLIIILDGVKLFTSLAATLEHAA